MRSIVLFLLVLTAACMPCRSSAEDFIIYTAHQEFLSRIYILNTDGSVHDYFEYEFFRLCDLEVVDNEVYVAEAFAPRMDKVDLETGELDVIIDDWSLYYFYGVAFDGRYFYVDEWDLNRYDRFGVKDGTASFDENVLGCAWDGSCLYTLDDTGIIRAWDIWSWPTVTPVPANDFNAPTTDCRGLWYDGESFWSAECKDGVLGYIYKFDDQGEVVDQWLEPAFSGWGVCVVDIPVTGAGETPMAQTGPAELDLTISNPVRTTSTIALSVPRSGPVSVEIYDTLGRRVATLLSDELARGRHDIPWTPAGLASGVYYCRLETRGVQVTRKVVVLR